MGSFVHADGIFFLIGVPLGAVLVNGEKCYAISSASPIGSQLLGKMVGHSFTFMGEKYEIKALPEMVEISYFIVLGFLVLPALDYFVGLRVLPAVVPSGEKDEKSSVGADGVSIIIACHNEASNIERKVLEITSQLQLTGVELFEIIVVDDGSRDDSVNILQNLESKEIIKLIKVEFRKGSPTQSTLGKCF